MQRQRKYKFTEKKHSRLGAAALVFGLAAIAAFVTILAFSAKSAGTLGAYAGILGIVFALLSLSGIIMGIAAARDEDKFHVLPKVAVLVCILALLIWGAVYVLGFYFWG